MSVASAKSTASRIRLVDVFAQRGAMHRGDHGITPQGRAAIDDRNALHGLHRVQPELHPPLNSHKNVAQAVRLDLRVVLGE